MATKLATRTTLLADGRRIPELFQGSWGKPWLYALLLKCGHAMGAMNPGYMPGEDLRCPRCDWNDGWTEVKEVVKVAA